MNEFRGDPNKMAPCDYVQYHPFTHSYQGGPSTECNGDVGIVAEIVCVHTFENENLDVFHPLYDTAPASSTVKRAIVTHTECQSPTEHEIIEAENFHVLVEKWISRLEESCQSEVRRILNENYAFLEYLE